MDDFNGVKQPRARMMAVDGGTIGVYPTIRHLQTICLSGYLVWAPEGLIGADCVKSPMVALHGAEPHRRQLLKRVRVLRLDKWISGGEYVFICYQEETQSALLSDCKNLKITRESSRFLT